MPYRVKLENFEGPLDLLLSLCEEQKLDICLVSLAKVADSFLEYCRGMSEYDWLQVADFLTVASRLLLVKSKALLPALELTEEEEEDILDLEARLKEYKRFKEAAEILGRNFAQKNYSFSREHYAAAAPAFFPSPSLKARDLLLAIKKIFADLPSEFKLARQKIRKVITLEEKIKELVARLKDRLETNFQELSGGKKTKMEIVLTFLAILHLIREQFITAEQKETFGEIKLIRMSTDY
jgi:segregation and condensation protein A